MKKNSFEKIVEALEEANRAMQMAQGKLDHAMDDLVWPEKTKMAFSAEEKKLAEIQEQLNSISDEFKKVINTIR